ncbi:ATP-grasp domain-containing protein [Spiribacter halobius]|uniref:ATP-grasp domain-containing protein n=1 Tax=Sediminicurvatus halobius TaxID=2182432 RepID=A0A2U2N8D1_9GAMM|nr:ATP-grasp domain-containing protein [Spiribacter halobius]PWG65416.1 hypothetical protein DEM34_01345 [Spiribacter halobius]UEX76436.1 ATP-grasp domain-containing protein [Spiribacter halobius]
MENERNIFVIGLDDFHRRLLQTVRGAEHYRFHGLIPYDRIVNPESYPLEDLLHDAQRELDRFPGTVDAIIGHWDFPTTSLLPLLQAHAGLPGPSLEAVLRCENKYWTRAEQAEATPDATPPFALVDPQDDAVLDDPPLPYPFWLKPVVAFSSTLGFRIDDRGDLRHALARIRPAIGRFAEPFDALLQRARLGARRASLAGGYCIAEGIIGGRGCTLEGYVLDGEPHIYAVIDSLRGPNGVSFVGYHYPSELPERVSERMKETTRRIIRHIGLEHSPFNIEFFWDEANDDIKLLEINPRISKSHSPLFELVDGASHHEVAIDVALGRRPEFPRSEGEYRYAAKFMPRVYGDAEVTRVPKEDDVARLRRRFPDAQLAIHVREGQRLSELPDQDSYSFEIGEIFLGGDSRDELTERFHEAMRLLDFRFSSRVETNYD